LITILAGVPFTPNNDEPSSASDFTLAAFSQLSRHLSNLAVSREIDLAVAFRSAIDNFP
jgi:hypothetical protein